jgi:anthranilate synthase
MPQDLKVVAISDDDVIMGIEHQELSIAAVQFHPESIMSLSGEVGLTIIANVINTYAKVKDNSSLLQQKERVVKL